MNRIVRKAILCGISMIIGMLTFFLCGCSKRETVLLTKVQEQIGTEVVTETEEESTGTDGGTAEEDTGKGDAAQPGVEQTDTGYYVHVCGAVNAPGVYLLERTKRICDAVEAAGGFCQDAQTDYLNLAEPLTDGMKIVILTQAEVRRLLDEGIPTAATMQSGNSIQTTAAGDPLADSGLVNLNTANRELLCTLPGVGETRADRIIAYREQNGSFQKIEDIMQVEGIKDGLYQKIRELITV